MQAAEAVRDPPRGEAGCESPEEVHLEADHPDEQCEHPVPHRSKVAQEADVQDPGGGEHRGEDWKRKGGQDSREA